MILSIPIIAGTISSSLHVISGPDHLAAVTPLVIETDKKVWKIGLAWGLGHLLGMLLIGLLFLFFKDFIPVETISEHSEQIVSFVLIGVGLWTFYRIFKEKKVHNHPHIHSEKDIYIHTHNHKHTSHSNHTHTHQKTIKQNAITSFGIGFLHGLAGIAHFLLLLPALSFKTNAEGVEYILGFALGTVTSMTIYAFILSKLTYLTKQKENPIFFKIIRVIGGLFAIVIGIYWLFLTF